MLLQVQVNRPLPPGQTLIYALSDPTTGAIRWVGTTILPASCFQRHLSGKRNHKVPGLIEWVAGLVEAGTPPTMLELAIEGGDFHRLCSHERYWVDRLREMGEQLFNS